MKRLLFSAGLAPLLATTALAGTVVNSPDPSATFMLGMAVEFGDSASDADVGFTAKILSTNKPQSFVFGAGVSFFPWAEGDQFGLDIDGGLLLDNVAILGGYDLLRQKLQVSGGFVPTLDDPTSPPPPPPPPMGPPLE